MMNLYLSDRSHLRLCTLCIKKISKVSPSLVRRRYQNKSPLYYIQCKRQYCHAATVSSALGDKSKIDIFRDKLIAGPSLDYFCKAPSQAEAYVSVNDIDPPPYIASENSSGKNRKVFIETYGCQMNVSDTEIAWAILKNAGFKRTDDIKMADVILVMTCAIREGAEQRIWNRLEYLKFLKRKREEDFSGSPVKLGILGCMAERLKEKLIEKEKMVDIVAGPDSYRDLPRLLTLADQGHTAVNVLLSLEETYADVIPVRVNTTSKTAFVSIMRGCDNMCTYCIVPFTRGRERSRPISSILDEIKLLSDKGIKEVTLLGQNVNSYRDCTEINHSMICKSGHNPLLSNGFQTIYKLRPGGVRFADLLYHVSNVDPEMRIRFTSPHPKDFPDEVLQVIKDSPNICNQLHLPAQSGNSEILHVMRRGYTRETYLDLVEHVKSFLPGVSLTSDFICGFCGETEEAHQDTLSLLNAVKYNFVYVFPYSMRQKTRAYHHLKDDVPHEVKVKRVNDVSSTFRNWALELNQMQVGNEHLVLVEGPSKRSKHYLVGRNDSNIKVIFPDIPISDRYKSENMQSVKPGDYIVTKIDSCSSQVLKGIPLYHTTLKNYEFHKMK